MLSISPPAKGLARAKYYMDLAREDYYVEGGEPPGKWFGNGAQRLGLGGSVKRHQFHALIQGYDPRTGAALVQNAGQDRQALWDLTFSAPKSVSVAWSQASENTRQEIETAHEDAVKEALVQLQDLYAWTRRGKEGQRLDRTQIVTALFEHGTSRAQDPQLHCHALLFNLGVRDDLSTGSLFIRPVFVAKMLLGALYRAEFAALLEQRLGFTCEKGPQYTFELKGRNPGLCSFFSKRSREVRQEMDRLGLTGAVAAQTITLRTRTTKEHEPRVSLFEKWRIIGLQQGWSSDEVQKARSSPSVREFGKERTQALQAAIDRLMHDSTYFNENALIRAVAEEAQSRGLRAKDVLTIAREAIASGRLQALGRGFFSTRECLQMEKDLLADVERTKDDATHALQQRKVEAKLSKSKGLSDEQKVAVRHITAGRGSISVLSGMAGTGKSTLLKVARELWEKEGYSVHGAAFTGKAARELQMGSGIGSRTIAKTQILLDGKGRDYWGKKLLAPNAPRFFGLNPLHGLAIPWLYNGRKNGLVLTRKSVLVIDEAGMVPTPQMKALLTTALQARAKVVLVGDARQLQAIGQGGAFASIAKRLGAAVLTEVRRQTQSWARQLVHHFANGQAGKALQIANDRGLLNVARTPEEAKIKLIEDWKTRGARKPENNLILAGTRADAADLNRRAQEERIKASILGRTSVKQGKERIYAGDRVLFTKNSSRLGVQNGALGTVKSIDRRFLTAMLDDGQAVTIPIANYQDFQLGYAVTTHKAQGMTTQNTFILLDSKMQDLHLSYVQASRAREITSFYMGKTTAAPNLTAMAEAMSRARDKQLATDLLEKSIEEERTKHAEEERRRQEHEQRIRHSEGQGHEHSY
jgi:conjugative relaxase-like TrwC/TraI family protein